MSGRGTSCYGAVVVKKPSVSFISVSLYVAPNSDGGGLLVDW